MKKVLALLLISSTIIQAQLIYPETKKQDIVDDYFGTKVPDPYRWLENDTTEETAEWVKQQNRLTFDYLEEIPYRDKVYKRLEELNNFEKRTAPFEKSGHTFYFRNSGSQNQSVLYIHNKFNDSTYVLLDPNTMDASGTTALSGFETSKDGRYFAYLISIAGSDWRDLYVIDLKTNKKLEDHISNIKFSGISWKGNGFYYSSFPSSGKDKYSVKNEFNKVFFHKLGTSQKDDHLIYEDKEHPIRSFTPSISEDEKHLFISGYETTSGNSLVYINLEEENFKAKELINGFDYDYWFVGQEEDKFIFLTNDNASNRRVISINPKAPSSKMIKEIFAEEEFVLESFSISKSNYILKYLKDAQSFVKVVSKADLKQHYSIELPGLGIVSSINTNDKNDSIYYSFTNFTTPSTSYLMDLNSKKQEVYFQPELPFSPSDYVTKQIFYTSKDGTKIPMFITHKKGLVPNDSTPTLLYGYGGFDISITPSYKVNRMILLENDGIYAVANIRGGGEYGAKWHEAGTQLNKQNVFDDFIAAAEYLIDNKYTSKEFLAIEGRSNGGLLIGACITQRPELFQVAYPGVGVLDMLRFHKFTIGWAWVGDYGSSDNEEQFKYLYNYSPVHNVKEVDYPATMVTTADHDDRVVPAHSYKFISELQDKHSGDSPVLIRIDVDAGHGAGKPNWMYLAEETDKLVFMFYNMGIKPNY